MKPAFLFAVLLATTSAALAGADAGSPRLNYMLHCSGCHGQDGAGSPGAGVPDMRGTLGHFLKARDGREFLIQVPGTSQSPLSDAQTAELLNWMLDTFSARQIPAGATPYTPREVAGLRAARLDDVPGRRAEIVRRLKEQGIAIQ